MGRILTFNHKIINPGNNRYFGSFGTSPGPTPPPTPPEPTVYDVILTTDGHGSISASPMSGSKDTLITLSNTPAQNYVFSKYTLNNVDLAGNTFLMPEADANVKGWFEADIRTITVTQPSHGTITAPASAQVGSTVTLSITTDTGYDLQYFTVNGSQIQGNTFVMPASDVTVSASVAAIEYTISVTQPSHGTITAPASATYGSTVTLSCTPDTGYSLDHFTVDGVQIVGNTFTMPASDVTVSASIAEDMSWKTAIYSRTASATSSNSPLQFTNTTQEGEYIVYEFDVKDPTLFIGSDPYTYNYTQYSGNVHGCRIEPNYICRSKVRWGKTDSSLSDYADFQYPICYNGAAVDSGSYRGTYWIRKSGVWGSDWHHVKIVYRWYQYTDPVVGQSWKGEAEFLIDGSVMFTSSDGSTDAYLNLADKIYLYSSTEIKNIEIYKTSDRSKVWVNP